MKISITSIIKSKMLGGYPRINSKNVGRLSWYVVHVPGFPRSIHGQITHLHLNSPQKAYTYCVTPAAGQY